jgi:hypothetical protein
MKTEKKKESEEKLKVEELWRRQRARFVLHDMMKPKRRKKGAASCEKA